MTTTPAPRGAGTNPASLPGRLLNWIRRRPAMAILSLLVGALLAGGSIVGVLAQALGPAAPSPAQGHAAVVAHGVGNIPSSGNRWRIFTQTATAGSKPTAISSPSFIMTTGNPVLVTDTTSGYQQRLAGGEAFFAHAGQSIGVEPFGAPQQYYLIQLGIDDTPPSSPAYYVSDAFTGDGVARDISLIRDVLDDQEAGQIPAGATPTLVLVLAGSLDVTASSGKSGSLKTGQAGTFTGDLTVMGTAAGTSYIAAYIGATIPEVATPVASPATPAPATPIKAATVAPTKAVPTATTAPTKVPPTRTPAPKPSPTKVVTPKASPAASPGASPAARNPKADDDKDGLTNAQEAALGTDPENPDTDADGISDGDEVNVY
ncbi:MAG TPA: hypothetical protein VFQ54_06580, partial [Thermomicrobiales bacterium]|nr:hypothetical protein [Thermomicrobiales bacterium]